MIFYPALPIRAQGKSLCFLFFCSVQELPPGPAGWEWAPLAVGMWQWGTGGIWELDEQRVMGRAASSVSLLVSTGVMAMSSSQEKLLRAGMAQQESLETPLSHAPACTQEL